MAACAGATGRWILANDGVMNPGGHPISDPLSSGSGDSPPFDVTRNSPIRIAGGQPHFVAVSGEDRSLAGGTCSFAATGTGTVAGFPGVMVEMIGVFDGDSASGTYAMGAGGELPGGEPIVFSFVGRRP